MHTFIRESKDGNYTVGRMVIVCSNTHDSHHEFEGMFHGLRLYSAIMLVSALNGGSTVTADSIKILEQCLVKG